MPHCLSVVDDGKDHDSMWHASLHLRQANGRTKSVPTWCHAVASVHSGYENIIAAAL